MSACPMDVVGDVVGGVAAQDERASRIRRMHLGDLGQVTRIENRIYDFPWNRNVFRSCFGSGYEGSVVELDRRIIGYGIMLVAAAECHLVNLCIDLRFQRRGLGRSLLRAMLARATSLGARRAILEVRPSNATARSLYLSENFGELSLRKNYYPTATGREDALVLAKLL